MRSPRYFGAPIYVMGGLLILLPTLDLVLSVFPIRVHATAWRFGAEGLFTKAFLTPFLGLTVLFLAAWLLEHRVVLRIVGVVSLLVSLLLAGLSVAFALDGLQMRAQVVPAASTAFAFTLVVTLAKNAAFFISALVLARAGWKAGRRPSGERERGGLLIREPSGPAAAAPTPTSG